jgi:hypothetical protein
MLGVVPEASEVGALSTVLPRRFVLPAQQVYLSIGATFSLKHRGCFSALTFLHDVRDTNATHSCSMPRAQDPRGALPCGCAGLS